MPELKKTLVEHDENTADIPRAASIEIERRGWRIGIFRFRSVAFAVEELHRHERVKEIADAARVQANFDAKFRSSELALGEFGENIEVDGSKENFGRPEREGGLENRARVGLQARAMHRFTTIEDSRRSRADSALFRADEFYLIKDCEATFRVPARARRFKPL